MDYCDHVPPLPVGIQDFPFKDKDDDSIKSTHSADDLTNLLFLGIFSFIGDLRVLSVWGQLIIIFFIS